MPVDPFIDELLSFLERRETRLLAWGFYDITFRPPEIELALSTEAPEVLANEWQTRRAGGATLDPLFVRMADAGLLYRPDPGAQSYRTRFGEGVRLLARLRQMFRANQWSTGPTLVSDIKLHVQRRRYPKQDQAAADCWGDLLPHSSHPARDEERFLTLVQGRAGTPLSFSGFQRRSFGRIFQAYGRPGTHGTVVSAGTGAGKTKAFYVPAMLQVAGELDRPPFTKVIAIYPRNVLLADQLREALAEAGKLAPVLARQGLRPIRFGALLGQAPWRDSFDQPQGNTVRAVAWHNWERVAGGYRIPFLRSPTGDADLVWRDADRAAGRHCLYPLGGSGGPHVAEGTLAFTRDELLREPPDVLFLSAEMLNREMGNPAWSRVLGLGQPASRSPRLLLLDEVHAYEGIPGAQIAWILRRWRHWARPRSLHVVGLSATLHDPVRHLAAVAGLRPDDIEPFAPDEDAGELTSEAQEYNLLIKGDAGSGANLLSTTIQTGMLLTRLLTPLGAPPSNPTDPLAPEAYFARKVFGFTDNLDVVNRWLSDLVDAEQNRLLASLRLHPAFRVPPGPVPARAVLRQMDAAGQIWELPRRLGHDLTRPVTVGRCTSQTPGLNVGDVLTVATSTLEVGYDDPEVGAVIQHKSPASLASFVQRKGRAGRQRGTRPWTVVVLSDFGRDRWDFQQAERLFSPRISALRLPTGNPYVLRIQAAYFLLDWLGRQVGSLGRHGPFHYLTRPTNRAFQDRVAALLRELLLCGPRWEQFRAELVACLRQPLDADGRRLTEAEVDAVIWHAPRPLLREVIPTLFRKLSAGWELADPARAGDQEESGFRHPLPRFLPQATFDDLDAADVIIQLPGANREPEFLGVDHALFETCPGRASKRYSLRPGDPGNWHPLSDRLAGGDLRVTADSVYSGAVALGVVGGTRVYQPVRATLVQHAPTVSESSFGSWEWESSFRTEGTGRSMGLPGGTVWARAFGGVEAFLHRDRSSVEVMRHAANLSYELLMRNGNSVRGRVVLERSTEEGTVPEAVGYRMSVDALRVCIRRDHLLGLNPVPPDIQARFRVEYFLHLLRTSPVISAQAGKFQADLLGQTAVAMLAATALRQRCSLRDAQPLLMNVRPQAAARVMATFFQTASVGAGGVREGRVRRRIRQLWSDPTVAGEIVRLEAALWDLPDAAFLEWCRRRYAVTLAQAVRSAVTSREDHVSEDDLMADVVWTEDGGAEIYITELSPGGLGLIEQVWRRLREDPTQFTDGLDHALDHCPRCENTAHLLRTVAAARAPHPPRRVARAFRAVRSARDVAAARSARRQLGAALRAEGLSASRDALVSLITRILGPGSGPRTDYLFDGLNRLWRRREATLGVSIDARVFAYLCVTRGRARRILRDRIQEVGEGRAPSRRQLFALVQQMLLLDCPDSCAECLDQPNRYAPGSRPSRGLARFYLGRGGSEVSADAHPADWPLLVRQELAARAVVRLRAGPAALPAVASRLPELLSEEVEAGFLLLPIRVRRVDREGDDVVLTLDLRDADHG
jgi:hypothetical protein